MPSGARWACAAIASNSARRSPLPLGLATTCRITSSRHRATAWRSSKRGSEFTCGTNPYGEFTMSIATYFAASIRMQCTTLKLLRDKGVITDDDVRAIITDLETKADAVEDSDSDGMAEVAAALRKMVGILD